MAKQLCSQEPQKASYIWFIHIMEICIGLPLSVMHTNYYIQLVNTSNIQCILYCTLHKGKNGNGNMVSLNSNMVGTIIVAWLDASLLGNKHVNNTIL